MSFLFSRGIPIPFLSMLKPIYVYCHSFTLSRCFSLRFFSLFLYFSLSSSSPFHRSASNKVDDGNKSVKNPYESTSEAKKSNTEAKLGVAVRDLRGGD